MFLCLQLRELSSIKLLSLPLKKKRKINHLKWRLYCSCCYVATATTTVVKKRERGGVSVCVLCCQLLLPNQQRTLNKLPSELRCRNFVNKHRLNIQIAAKRQKRVCNVYVFQLSFHSAYHHWWLGAAAGAVAAVAFLHPPPPFSISFNSPLILSVHVVLVVVVVVVVGTHTRGGKRCQMIKKSKVDKLCFKIATC